MKTFRGKFTTTDYKESRKNPDLIYLPKKLYEYIDEPLVIRRCKECARVLNLVKANYYHQKGYCDLYCYEISNPPKLNHKCKYCDNEVLAYKMKNGKNKGHRFFGKLCKECKESKAIPKKRIRKYIPKPKDLIGHTCKHCGVYKKWEEFPFNKKAEKVIHYRCNSCCIIDHKKVYQDKKLKNQNVRLKNKPKGFTNNPTGV